MATVTEIRVHGVGGASAAQLLGDSDIAQVAGDGTAGFFRSRQGNDEHHTEAYVWGGLTSKALITGFWWLLLPFTLVNVAGWMLQPPKKANRKWPLQLTRGLVRIGGLGLTIVYVLYLSVLFVDVLAVRCGADPACSDRWLLAPLRWFPSSGVGDPVWRAVAGAATVLFFVALLFGASSRNRRLHENFGAVAISNPPPRSGRTWRLEDPDFWCRIDSPGALYRAHLTAATMTVGFVAGTALQRSYADVGWPEDTKLRVWIVVFAALSCLLIAFLAKPDRYEWDKNQYRDLASREPLAFRAAIIGWGAAHITVTAGAGLIGWRWRRNTDSTDLFAEHGSILLVNWIAYGVIGLILALLFAGIVRQWGRNLGHIGSFVRQLGAGLDELDAAEGTEGKVTEETHTRRNDTDKTASSAGFRVYPVPAAIGLGLVLVFAGFSGVLVRTIALLQTDETTVALKTDLIGGNSSFFAFSAFITAVVVLFWFLRRSSRTAATAAVRKDYNVSEAEMQSPSRHGWVRSVASARLNAGIGRRADVLSTLFLLVFAITMIVLLVQGGDAVTSPLFGWAWLESLGSWILVVFLFPGVFVLRAAFRARDSRRTVGKVWDVLTFWPRVYHPLAAPCYAERAVPELRDRIRHLTKNGDRVVLAAHSQGTVLCYAAVASLAAEPDGEVGLSRVSMVTFGSPIRQLFIPFFPEYFATTDVQEMASRLDPQGSWLNFYRDTDYIGKHLFDVPAAPSQLPAQPSPTDVLLLDPEKPEFPTQKHSNYEQEPLLRKWVKSVSANRERPVREPDSRPPMSPRT